MRDDIQGVLTEEWHTPFDMGAPRWMGAFTRLEILITVRGCAEDGRCIFFEVQAEGHLVRVEEESPLVSSCLFQRVRIVAAASRRWHVDPDSQLRLMLISACGCMELDRELGCSGIRGSTLGRILGSLLMV